MEDSPGFKEFVIHPAPVGDLTWAKADFDTMYGTVSVDWKVEDGIFEMDVAIPVNTTATVYVPGMNPLKVGSGRHSFVSEIGDYAI